MIKVPDIRRNDNSRALKNGSVTVFECGTTVPISYHALDELGHADIDVCGVYDVAFYDEFGDCLHKSCNEVAKWKGSK